MLKKLLAGLLCTLAPTAPAQALDIQQSTAPVRAPGILNNGGIAINRADGVLNFKAPDGATERGLLPDLDASGYLKFRNGLTLGRWVESTRDLSSQVAIPGRFGMVSASLATLLGNAQASVATTAALKAIGLPYSRIRREGFYAAGDGGAMDYSWSSSNCLAANDGAQVQPTGRTGCWIADPTVPVSLATFGAQGNGTFDDGPAIRAACAYGALSGKPIKVRRKAFLLKTLDVSGLGAIVLGTGATGANAQTCDLVGEGTSLLPDNAFAHGPVLKLGDGLNRPLVYVHPNTRNPTWAGIALSGNKTNQAGWSGGPNGWLFTVQIADDLAGGSVESGFRMDGVVMRDGYNGNLYLGSGRGGLWLKDTWSQYSGKNITDPSIWLNGYDATFINIQVGSNTGRGVLISQGSQYQFVGGACFLNGGPGWEINGYKVQHLTATSINYQGNGQEGVKTTAGAPYADTQGGVHAFNNIIFEGNSAAGSGLYSDMKLDTNAITTITGVGFPGRIVTTGSLASTLPKYNIETVGATRVSISGVSRGSTPGVGTSYTVGFTNNCALLTGEYPETCTWTPILKGDTAAGTPTYTRQFGSLTRSGNSVTVSFALDTTALGGADGNVLIGGLPLFSQTSTADYGACSIGSWSGWTAPAGKTALGGIIPPNGVNIYLVANGTDASGSTPPAWTQFAAATRLYGNCIYRVQ